MPIIHVSEITLLHLISKLFSGRVVFPGSRRIRNALQSTQVLAANGLFFFVPCHLPTGGKADRFWPPECLREA